MRQFIVSVQRRIKLLAMKCVPNMYDNKRSLDIVGDCTSKIIQTENPIQAPRAPPSADMKVVVVYRAESILGQQL